MQWAYARIASIASLMSERSQEFQINVTGKAINRHTPANRLKVYTYAPERYGMEAMVLADTYHDNYLKDADTESVNFWQSIETTDAINVTPVYLNANGTLITGEALNQADIFGVMFDEEALGYTVMDETVASTPLNASGLYYNTVWHWTTRYYNDFTEKGVVLLLD